MIITKMKALKQWIVVGPTKRPAIDSNQMTYQEAKRIADRKHNTIVAFVLTENDPFWCIDCDGGLTLDHMHHTRLAEDLAETVGNSVVAVSQSKKGVHFWGCADLPEKRNYRNQKLRLDLHFKDRYVIWTDEIIHDGSEYETPTTIADVIKNFFTESEQAK